MPTTASDDGVVLGLKFDISRVKQTLDQVKNMVQGMAEDSAKAVAKTDDVLEKARKNAEKWKIEPTTKGIEAAQKELDILNATIVNQQNELSNCEREHERLADKYGETSSQALKLEKRMLNLQASIEKNTKKSDDFGAALADAQDVMDAASGSAEDLEKNAKGAGKGMEDGGKGAKTFDVALGTLAGNALSAVISKCGELMEQTKELRRDLSFLEQNARDAGMGMEQLHNKAGELYAVTGDTNEVVEALSNILATGFDDADKAYEAVDLLAGAVVKFPETMKIESLADSLQETIATGEAVGQFSELLGRLGVDVEKFNERLGRTRSEASRQNLALQTLRKEGLDELWESYKAGNSDMIEAEKANYNLQLRYVELAKSIEPIETKIKTTFAQVLLDHEDQILAIVDAAGDIIGVGADVIGFLSELNPAVVLVSGGQLAHTGHLYRTCVDHGHAADRADQHGDAGSHQEYSSAHHQQVRCQHDELGSGRGCRWPRSGKRFCCRSSARVGGAGYARGTRSATPGWRWVGENGPELMRFAGGEAVYTAEQSRALISAQGGGATFVDNSQNIFKVDDIVPRA